MTNKTSRAIHLGVEIVIALFIVGAIVAYAMSSVRVPVSRNWAAFSGETLIVFWNVIAFVRKHMQTAASWRIVTGTFVAHVAIGSVACAYIEGIPLVWFALAGIAEIVLILGILQRVGPTPTGTK